jgi:hypothetical protein
MAGKLKDAPEQTQGDLWPELDTTDPKQKKLLQLARKYAKDKTARDELLSTAKEKQDSAMAALLAAMHECGIEKFRYEGVKVEIIPGKEKAQVKLDDGDDDESASDE